MSEDVSFVLIDYLSTIENIPLEVDHIFAEMKTKELLIMEIQKRINSLDSQLQKQVKLFGALQPHPKEAKIVASIRQDYEQLIAVEEEKKALADKAYALVDKHYKRLDESVRKLETDRQLMPDSSSSHKFKKSLSRDVSVNKFRYFSSNPKSFKRRESLLKIMKKYNDSDDDDDYQEFSDLYKSAPTLTGEKRVRLLQDDDSEVYCFCRQVSYGEMVACDDPDCELEWFHLGCVGLKNPPSGKWYCTACRERREGRRISHR